MKLVSVITPSRLRTSSLLRAAQSVCRQHYPRIEHIIIGDNHPRLTRLTSQLQAINPRITVLSLKVPTNIVYRPWRTAIVRNHGISIANGDYIAHLDDDNEMEPEHIASLVSVLEDQKADAAHSWRKLYTRSGRPLQIKAYPWCKNGRIGKYLLTEFLKAGIYIPRSNECRDVMVTPTGDVLLHVDSSEWLVQRTVHQSVKFPISYTLRNIIHEQTEDYLLASEFYNKSLRIACSNKATLRYYLGGYSNSNSLVK